MIVINIYQCIIGDVVLLNITLYVSLADFTVEISKVRKMRKLGRSVFQNLHLAIFTVVDTILYPAEYLKTLFCYDLLWEAKKVKVACHYIWPNLIPGRELFEKLENYRFLKGSEDRGNNSYFYIHTLFQQNCDMLDLTVRNEQSVIGAC